MRTIADIDADISELKNKMKPLENERKEAQKMCNHVWERHNFVIDGECIVCAICNLREKIWGCGL